MALGSHSNNKIEWGNKIRNHAERRTPNAERPDQLSYLNIFTSRRMAAMLLLGFASGLPLPLTGGNSPGMVDDYRR